MRNSQLLLGLVLLGSLLVLTACSSDKQTTLAQQRAEQDRIRKVCSEHYAHIEGLNDGRYGRKVNKDYAGVTGCPYNQAEINEEYLEGFKYGMAHK